MVGGLTALVATLFCAHAHAHPVCDNDPGCDPTHPYLIAWQALPAPTYPVWRRVIRLQADETVRDRAAIEGAGTVFSREYRVLAVTLNQSESVYRSLVLELGAEHADPALNDTSPSRVDELRISVIAQGPSQPARVLLRRMPSRVLSVSQAQQIACPTDPQVLRCADLDRLATDLSEADASLVSEATRPIRAGRPLVPELVEAVLETAGWQQNLRGARLFIGPQEPSESASVTTSVDAGIQSFTRQNILPPNLLVVDSQSGNGGGLAVGWSEAVQDDSVRAVLYRAMAFEEQPGQALTQTVQVCARGRASSGLCL